MKVSRAELERKLAPFDEPPGSVAKVLDSLQAKGFINEARVADSVLHLGGGSWFGVWVYAGLLFSMLFPLSAFREMSFVLGKDVLWGIVTRRESSS